jgi:hypothetical protein
MCWLFFCAHILLTVTKNQPTKKTMGNFFTWNAADIAPTQSIKLLEKLREALNCAITLSNEEIDHLTTELTFEGEKKVGVHIPSYLATLKRNKIEHIRRASSRYPRLPEKVGEDKFDVDAAIYKSAEYITYSTEFSTAALMLAEPIGRIGFKAVFGSSVEYRSGHSGVEIDFSRLKEDWRRMKGGANYKHRKASYIRWLRTLVKERGSDYQLEKLEKFFDSLDELDPIKPEVTTPKW